MKKLKLNEKRSENGNNENSNEGNESKNKNPQPKKKRKDFEENLDKSDEKYKLLKKTKTNITMKITQVPKK